MERRKTIALLSLMPETTHGNRVMEGVFRQCEKYGYNTAVFASMVPLQFYYQDYSDGETQIYDLPDLSFFDGIIIDSLSLTDKNDLRVSEHLKEKLRTCKHGPVVCLDEPWDDHKTLSCDNSEQLREMCRHVVLTHGKRDILVITGFKGDIQAETRLSIFLDELKKLGAEPSEENIVYGDFWYSCGEQLADEILSGKRRLPEAVIGASDHMVIGLVEKLTRHGIRVPEDMIAVGFEATPEASLSDTSLSSYESSFTKNAADAVDYIRSLIEPDVPLYPYEMDMTSCFHPGMSCGCEPDLLRSARAFKNYLYTSTRNYNPEVVANNVDIGLLMENYVSEIFTASETPEKCIENIYMNTYLLFPLTNFALCLKEDWLTAEKEPFKGYPKRMKTVITNSKDGHKVFYDPENAFSFDTKLMYPILQEYTEKPSVFYFSALHFGDDMLGYTVLQRPLSESQKINLVTRNWLRMVNNALEMVRTKNKYIMLSIRDNMTGLYNRRGMYELFEKLSTEVKPEDRLFCSVIDMDGLKYVNDTFGHDEGDYGILAVSRAAQNVTHPGELCVRAGGDEFYIIGIGRYTDDECEKRRDEYLEVIAKLSQQSGKPYPISASIGCALGKAGDRDLEELLRIADEEMYRFKIMRKKHRTQ
ncbi:GGDEF domain-containing protein [Ruminococcus sp.]|uniref:substrate-binding and GGDEF domain-containing protein n=1 Tax=Ruminococcus sp. TaxID=41978 RepID=UPI0025F4E466|nr:GGDEF domain-containing protein [Ruminococcus sp.]MBQ8965563.1 GGDEF domain-containing protein [Ruminococcus sp.]